MSLDPCSSLASANVKADCIKTDDAASSATGKCCLVSFTGMPTISSSKAVTAHTTGSVKDGSNLLACMKRTSGKLMFVTAHDAATWANRKQIGYLKGSDACGATGVVKAGAITGKSAYKTTGTSEAAMATDTIAGTVASCVCGVKGGSPCEQLAGSKVKADCTKTDDAASGTKAKCCLATFATPPTTSSAKAVTAGGTGSVIADSKFYACYKKSGGSILFTTHASATTEKSL